MMLKEFIPEYLRYAETAKAKGTVTRDKRKLPKLLEAFGNLNLDSISIQAVEAYMHRRRSLGASPATVNRDVALLKHILHKALDWNYIHENPVSKVKLLKEPPGRTRYLSTEERQRLLAACSGILKAIVMTALFTGMRKGELQDLRWSNINFERKEIVLRKTKNNEVRVIPVPDALMQVLQVLDTKSDYVFHKSDGKPYGDCKKAFKTACRRAGINDFRFHDLRHTFASYLAIAGYSAFVIQRLTGHKTLAMAQRYTHLSESCIREAVESVTKMSQQGLTIS